MRKLMIVLLCVGVLVSWQLWQGDIVSAGEKWGQSAGKAFECSPVGMWRVKMDAAPPSDNDVIQTIIPLDPTGKRFAVSTEIIKWNVTLGGFFPLAVHITNPRGIAVKVSPDTYESTTYAFATDANGDMVYYLVMSGVSMWVDCDNSVTVLAYEVFFPDGTSFGCAPETATLEAERLKLVPPCMELPPFPDFDG
jgi:hypothetical protein